jgi:hypothetical protein
VQLALVESKLLALQDVAVAPAGLAGPAGHNGVETTGLELLLESGVDLAAGGEAGGLLLLDRVALLGLLGGLLALGLLLALLAPAAEGLAVVGLVPLAEGGGVDLDDGGLGQGVGADQLVVGRVVGDDDDARLAGAALGGPGEVAGVEAQGAVLVVAAAGADDVDPLGADTGVGGLAAQLESALLPCWQRSERIAPLVLASPSPSDTHERWEDTTRGRRRGDAKSKRTRYGLSMCITMGLTHGSRRASHRRQSACDASLSRYP